MLKDIRIAVIDDHPLFREGVAATLRADERMSLVGQGACAEDAIRLCEEMVPDIILLDISMPGDGLAAARHISRICPVVKIVMLTASEDEGDVTQALEAGAKGYVLKGIGARQLIETVTSIHSGQTYVTPALAARLLTQMRTRLTSEADDDISTLTPREEQILAKVTMGLTNKEVAIKLSIAEKTVKHYMTNIMQKLQVRNRVEAVLAARKRGELNGSTPLRQKSSG